MVIRRRFLLLAGLALAAVAAAGAGAVSGNSMITRVAGPSSYSVSPGFSGDGGPATAANLNIYGPDGTGGNHLAVAANGDLYISESANNRIRKVSRTGTITTFARLRFPGSIAFDSHGNLFVVQPKGNTGPEQDGAIISKLAPDGTWSEYTRYVIWPGDIAVDSGDNLYFVDQGLLEEFRQGHAQEAPTIVVNPKGRGLELIDALALDAKGHVYFSNAYSVRKLLAGGSTKTIAGKRYGYVHSLICDTDGEGGRATKARIAPGSLAVDRAGNVYFRGLGLRKVDPAGRITTIVHDSRDYVDGGKCTAHQHDASAANSGPAIKAHVSGWSAEGGAVVAAPNGSVYVTDGRNRVLKIG